MLCCIVKANNTKFTYSRPIHSQLVTEHTGQLSQPYVYWLSFDRQHDIFESCKTTTSFTQQSVVVKIALKHPLQLAGHHLELDINAGCVHLC